MEDGACNIHALGPPLVVTDQIMPDRAKCARTGSRMQTEKMSGGLGCYFCCLNMQIIPIMTEPELPNSSSESSRQCFQSNSCVG